MPLIQFQTNQFLSDGGASAASQELSALLAELLQKPESYVQVVVEGGIMMSFGGTTDPTALLQLSSLGLSERQAAECSKRLCRLMEERFSIPAGRVYIKMADHPRKLWGWNGGTFG
ncbi:MAG: phenylpyruvate tautomerase MIF-related protein [Verrucomicrobiota bacterium]